MCSGITNSRYQHHQSIQTDTKTNINIGVLSNLFNGTLLVLAGLLFIYVFDLLANSEHGYGFLQKKSYDVAVEEAAYTLGAILELQQQVT